MDTVDAETRSRIMSSVSHKDTRPEKILRSALHKVGLRYRLHVKELPGTPDLVFPRFGAVLFINGCYWHFHGCHKSTLPKSNREFWVQKFRTNRVRDRRDRYDLIERGWRVLVVWECSLIGKHALAHEEVVERVRIWLEGVDKEDELSGCPQYES